MICVAKLTPQHFFGAVKGKLWKTLVFYYAQKIHKQGISPSLWANFKVILRLRFYKFFFIKKKVCCKPSYPENPFG